MTRCLLYLMALTCPAALGAAEARPNFVFLYNDDQRFHHEATVSWGGYLGTGEFWGSTLENWQSEFLAVGSFSVFAIYLRQRGSSQSKPVGASHDATGVEG